jgi:molybdate transport system substrate-binding protein
VTQGRVDGGKALTTQPDLVVLSAGAAKGLVEALHPRFRDEAGVGIAGTFGAVGTIREQFLGDGPCDVLILTATMLDELARVGKVVPETIAPLGEVLTGVAVPAGDPHPPIGDREALKACFGAAQALYCPDTERATAGIHFAKVLRALSLWPEVAGRVKAFPSGAVAMKALAQDPGPGRVGCTQVTEILYTSGVELVGVLPEAFKLATTYSAAVAAHAAQPAIARRFAATLTSPEHADLRARGGFVAHAAG